MTIKIYINHNLYYLRSNKECAGYCLADSQCSAFFWNESVAICQTSSATNLAGDLTSQAAFGYIDKTLQPGYDLYELTISIYFDRPFKKGAPSVSFLSRIN